MHDLQHTQFGFVWEISDPQPKKSHVIKRKQMCLLFLLSSVLIVFCTCCLLFCNIIKLRDIDAFFHIEICQNWLLHQVCYQDRCFAVSYKMIDTSQKWCSLFIMFLETADSNVFIFQLHLFFQQLSIQLSVFSFSCCFEFNLQRFNSVHSCNNITSLKVTDSMTSWLAVSLFSWSEVIYLSSSELWFILWKMMSCMI